MTNSNNNNYRRGRSMPSADDSANERDTIESLIDNIRSSTTATGGSESQQQQQQQQQIGASTSSEGIWADDDLDAFLESDALLNVTIKSSASPDDGSTNFYIPVSLMVEREQLMRVTAKQFGIGADRWGDSLLYREWRNTRNDTDSDDINSAAPTLPTDRPPAHRMPNGDVTVHLDPERDCAKSNHSHTLEWKPWLTTCIRAFYNTGTVRIPDGCVGSDILLALEYFGIVYTPDQLVFDSFGAYLRVKLWSEYYTHRSTLAQWVVQKLLHANSKHSHTFVTSPSAVEGDAIVVSGTSKRADVLDGNLILDPVKFAGTPCCAVVHDFFHDEDKPEGVGMPLDAMMREDFAHYVQNSLPGTKVNFTLRDVRILQSGTTLKRPTLHIEFIAAGKQQQKQQPVRAAAAAAPEEEKKEEHYPPQQHLPPRSRSKSPSLFRRIGSGILKNKGSSSDISTGNRDLGDNIHGTRDSSTSIHSSPSNSSRRRELKKTQSAPLSEPPSLRQTKPQQQQSTSSSLSDMPNRQPVSQASAQQPTRTPVAQQKKITRAPSADHIYEDVSKEKKRLKNGSSSAVSVDQINMYSELDDNFANGTLKPRKDQPSAAPSDEKKIAEAKAKATAAHSTAPSDEHQSGGYTYYRAPVRSTWLEGDQVTVASGLTSPFREDDSTVRSFVMGGQPKTSIAATEPISKRSMNAGSKSPRGIVPDARQIKRVECIQRLMEEDETDTDGNSNFLSSSVNNSNFFSSGYTSSASTKIDRFTAGESGPQCGGAELMNSTMCYIFGATSTKKSGSSKQQQQQQKFPWHPRSNKVTDVDAESLAGRGTSAMSAIERFLPEVELPATTDDDEAAAVPSLNGRETIESTAAAWLRNAINFNNFIYDDPVPENDDDEYLRLARQAGSKGPRKMPPPQQQKRKETAGTLVKDIIDGLMSDNSSFVDGSMASTEVSSHSASQTASYTMSTVSSRKYLVKDSYVPFGDGNSTVASTVIQSSEDEGSSKRGGNSAKFVPRPLPSGHAPPTNSRHGSPQRVQRRRFPTPSRAQTTPPRAPKDESRNGTPTKQRAISPLARIPALLPGKRRGKKGEDNSESTPQIKNGVRTVEDEMETTDIRKKSPSRIAGLFRSKGLVRRKSVGGENKQEPSQSSVGSDEYRICKGKLYNM